MNRPPLSVTQKPATFEYYRPVSAPVESPPRTQVKHEPSAKLMINLGSDEKSSELKNPQTVENQETTTKRQSPQPPPPTAHQQPKQPRKPSHVESSSVGSIEWPSHLYKLMNVWYPLRLKLNYPKKSTLNSHEQKEFIEFHNRFKARTKVTQQEVKFYKKYLVSYAMKSF